jgi:hypothetical protein
MKPIKLLLSKMKQMKKLRPKSIKTQVKIPKKFKSGRKTEFISMMVKFKIISLKPILKTINTISTHKKIILTSKILIPPLKLKK